MQRRCRRGIIFQKLEKGEGKREQKIWKMEGGRRMEKGKPGRKSGKRRWREGRLHDLERKGEREMRAGGGGRRASGDRTDICLAFIIGQAMCFHINYFIKPSQNSAS